MSPAFLILALITLGGAVAAMSLRNLVHCALCLVVTFAGLAGLYLQLDAQFVGLVQILVYVGAVAILIVFAILLTRNIGSEPPPVISVSAISGIVVALLAFGTIAGAICHSGALARTPLAPAAPTVKQIGQQLMTTYVLPMEVIGLLLTSAMIGAVVIALREKKSK